MTIVFVIDNYWQKTNGTIMTAKRFADALIEKGHTIRIVSEGVEGENNFNLEKRNIPLVSFVAKHQDITFAKPDIKIFEKAFEGADVVHFFMPWKIAKVGIKVAKKMKIPYTAAFHVQPENITYGAGLGRCGGPVASLIYYKFRTEFYKKVKHVHVPSNYMADTLKKYNYKSNIHVISNGISEVFKPIKVEKNSEYFEILMIGRFAKEKRQKILISAIAKSKYKDKIHLTLAGSGPYKKRLDEQAKKLNVNITFGFYCQEELIEVINKSDLYVHAADVESEAIACLEAIACGIVPVICNAKKSAAKQFALDERSLFKPRDTSDLARKIDYWYENPDEKETMKNKYIESSKKYHLDNCVDNFVEMLEIAIKDYKKSK